MISELRCEDDKLLAGEAEGSVGREGVPGRWGNGDLSRGNLLQAPREPRGSAVHLGLCLLPH